jgi:hypothetical protein
VVLIDRGVAKLARRPRELLGAAAERQPERRLAGRPHDRAQAEGDGRVEDVEVHRHVGVERHRRRGEARRRDVRQVHDGVAAAQHLRCLPVVREVRPQDTLSPGVCHCHIGRHHLIAVLDQVPHGCPAGLARRSRHADPP